MNEGLRILEEEVAVRASDIDVVWSSGYGFPRYRGGPMHWEPASLLAKLVREGKTLAQWGREQANKG